MIYLVIVSFGTPSTSIWAIVNFGIAEKFHYPTLTFVVEFSTAQFVLFEVKVARIDIDIITEIFLIIALKRFLYSILINFL